MSGLALGIDLGTSGIRSAVVDATGSVVARARAAYKPQIADKIDAEIWWDGVQQCIANQMSSLHAVGRDPEEIARIAVDGTSGTMVLTDEMLRPVTRALMYNSGGFLEEAAQIAQHAPDPHITRGASSALARLMHLQTEDTEGRAMHLLHQADFIAAKLMGRGGFSDQNNALKTGFDPETESWPSWAEAAGVRIDLLPVVVPAGSTLFPISNDTAQQFGLLPETSVHAGTTDSIAAFLASAPSLEGAAVTSLGTTLAVKMLSPVRIDAPEIGLYSHRVGRHWLVGGASNTGGGVLLAHFTVDELSALSAQIDPNRASDLNYYPLLKPGERFPVSDPCLRPVLNPRPPSDIDFLHGLLESIARIERRCYAEIHARGGGQPSQVITAGGGARNEVWRAIRQRVLGCAVNKAAESEAAVGTALLAQG